MALKLHVAVHHFEGGGVQTFVGFTQAAALKRFADDCRACWEDNVVPYVDDDCEDDKIPPDDDETCIRLYFDYASEDYWEWDFTVLDAEPIENLLYEASKLSIEMSPETDEDFVTINRLTRAVKGVQQLFGLVS